MDTLDALGFDRLSKTDIFTPVKITQDMVNLLPEEVFHPDFKFLDIACKSGRFLVTLKDRLMESPTMIEIFPDKKDRLNHILNNQLFGLATSEMCLMISTRNLYGSISEFRNIRYIANYTDKVKEQKINIEYLEKEFNRDMKIDVVIGNPPYNNDTYLDFVQFGHSLASQYTIMITPAKWQAKGGEKNEQFRKNIVPYMEKIVYYPDCTDIFIIQEPDGICFYLIDKKIHSEKHINNICILNNKLNDYEIRALENTLLNGANKIINKIKATGFNKFNPTKYRVNDYNVFTNDSISIGGKAHKKIDDKRYTYILSNKGNFMCISTSEITEKRNMPRVKNSCLTFSSGNIEECISFIKWTETKFVRFLFFAGLLARNSIGTDYGWRFVPDPINFDHIFTDEELYKKYNLTEEEIAIIESVIKERK